MRPVADRWLTCQICNWGTPARDGKPTLCVVQPDGKVLVRLLPGTFSIDGGVFFDGVTFIAESSKPTSKPKARKRSRATR